jgi:glycosyltransferase involved in cell wall biosynthesis
MKILFIVNVDWFFLSHRLPLATEAISKGHTVFLVTKDTGKRELIESYGITFINLNFERSGNNPISEFFLIFKIRTIIAKIKPDIIHNVTIKPIIYGSIAYKFVLRKAAVVNAISGLGYNFIGNRNSLSQKIIGYLMNFAYKARVNFIFQNPDDLNFYRKLNFLKQNKYCLIKGSGVDENEFQFSPKKSEATLKVVFVARMLKDKGVFEFINAAHLLRNKWYGKVKFYLLGDVDPHNPASAKKEEIEQLLTNDYIIWSGYQANVIHFLIDSDIVCLPSYREGLPKSLIEAMAIGRPIVTTDVPGCRECVEDGYNGYLVDPQNAEDLALKLELLLLDEAKRSQFGINSRKKMLAEFSLNKVLKDTFNFYDEIRC